MLNSTTSGDSPAKPLVSKNVATSLAIARLHTLIIRWAFRRFYHEFAWTYTTVAWGVSRGLWRHWVLAALPYVRGRTLELGCGTGYVQHAIPQQHQAVGLDASPSMLAQTQRRLNRSQRRGMLVRGVAQALPFAPATFQTILATFPSEYIISPDTLAEIQRVHTPDGQWIIVDAPRFTHAGWHASLVDIAYRLIFGVSVVKASDSLPPLPIYERLFEQAGMAMTVHDVPVGASRVLVLVGTRPGQKGV